MSVIDSFFNPTYFRPLILFWEGICKTTRLPKKVQLYSRLKYSAVYCFETQQAETRDGSIK